MNLIIKKLLLIGIFIVSAAEVSISARDLELEFLYCMTKVYSLGTFEEANNNKILMGNLHAKLSKIDPKIANKLMQTDFFLKSKYLKNEILKLSLMTRLKDKNLNAEERAKLFAELAIIEEEEKARVINEEASCAAADAEAHGRERARNILEAVPGINKIVASYMKSSIMLDNNSILEESNRERMIRRAGVLYEQLYSADSSLAQQELDKIADPFIKDSIKLEWIFTRLDHLEGTIHEDLLKKIDSLKKEAVALETKIRALRQVRAQVIHALRAAKRRGIEVTDEIVTKALIAAGKEGAKITEGAKVADILKSFSITSS